MGIFKKMKEMTGSVDPKLMRDGQLGRGIITELQQTNVSRGPDFAAEPVCVITLEVTLDNVPRFTASCRQPIPVSVLGQIQPGSSTVAVRVDPNNHENVAIDLSTAPPEVTMAADDPKTASAADILARGTPCRAVIVQGQDMGTKNQAGTPIYAFVLTIILEGKPPYQIQVGNPVPAAGQPLVYNGCNVPAKVLPDNPNAVVIDWDAAVAEFEKK
jgi:hypothetical protein